jgi:hypothetical protein
VVRNRCNPDRSRIRTRCFLFWLHEVPQAVQTTPSLARPYFDNNRRAGFLGDGLEKRRSAVDCKDQSGVCRGRFARAAADKSASAQCLDYTLRDFDDHSGHGHDNQRAILAMGMIWQSSVPTRHSTIKETAQDLPNPTTVVPFGIFGAGLWTAHPIGLVIVIALLLIGFVGLQEYRLFLALAVPAGVVCGFLMWRRHRDELSSR